MKNIWLAGIMGVIIGDALGMPVQFMEREELKINPVTSMQGYGTYNMPPGTWSDDGSMTLATLASICEMQGMDCQDIMERFVKWHFEGEYTPEGKAFDQGFTCMEAICNYKESGDYLTCGKTGEHANGNGALMRIMPVCLFGYEKVKNKEWTIGEAVANVHKVAALTHNHLRSHIACGIYYFLVSNILDMKGSLVECLQAGIDDAMRYYGTDVSNYRELAYYSRLFQLSEFAKCEEEDIKSSGYVVDTLEAVVWSLVATDTFEKALLRAVNLADDADTVGAIAGGLAGLYYGYESIPKEWLEEIVRREWIEELCEDMR